MADVKEIEHKWLMRWQDSKIFEAVPKKGKKKFFGTFPYPYVNSYLHLGHFYSSMRLEAFSRYKRMLGFNVLYAQGWHCTGSPIVNAALRIKENEPKQLEILRMQGFSDSEIRKFAEPERWAEYFPKEAKKDFNEMGYSIDWRREFITTELNPSYDRFIRWQFRKLREKGYVLKGRFPVVWDPKENAPVGDHDRIEGEGETPQEYVLVKHRLGDKWVVTATLRPDTIMGITNLFVNPESRLVEAKVDDEVWIISEKTANELMFQDKKVKILEKIKGTDIIGKKTVEFSGHAGLILPAVFVDVSVGTGIVHGCPSDSADDLIALYDLQENPEMCRKYGLDVEEVRKIKPIPVLDVPGYGKAPAIDILEKFGIKSQHEHEKLQAAKEVLYKDGYYKGRFNKLYKSNLFKKDYSGKPVEKHKEEIKQEIIESDFGDVYYQLSGKVVARTLAECVVKIVDDQWFMAYGDIGWKKLAHDCLDQMKLYPEKTRSQFDYVLDWLRNWACTRELGLGTKLPWDNKWIIESLSDSTIYMAYYTIAHKINKIDAEKLDDNFFDYVFLGKNKAIMVDKKIAEELRQEFMYWYPMDFRTTGKDLIQNHMSFCIFNHTAIFPRKHWPKSFGLNGHVTVDGEKMSKSKGNFIIMRQANKDYGADASRFTTLSGGEGIDDANFDRELAKSISPKLMSLLDFAKQYYNTGRTERLGIDEWMESKIDENIAETTNYYEDTLFRSALQTCYFDMQNTLKWYLRRCLGNPNKTTLNRFIEAQALLMAPITPFICEEIWETIGKKNFVSLANWPRVKRARYADKNEDMIKATLEDITSVLNLLKVEKPKSIKLFVAENWKYELYGLLRKEMEKSREFNVMMQSAMKHEGLKQHSKDIVKIIQRVIKTGINYISTQEREFIALLECKEFFEKEFKTNFEIIKAEASKEPKARQALPGKPAIVVE